MKLFDRVRYIGSDEALSGKEGTLVYAIKGYYGIKFDEVVPEGHDLSGKCESGYGLYVVSSEVEKISKFKHGDRVCVIFEDLYGSTGTIEKSAEIDENTVYTVRLNDEEVIEVEEQMLIMEEHFVPAPFSIGQTIEFNEEELAELKTIVNTRIILDSHDGVMKVNGIKLLDGNAFYIRTNYGDYIEAKYYKPTEGVSDFHKFCKLGWEKQCSRQQFKWIIDQVAYNDHTDTRYAFYVRLYIEMLAAPFNIQKIETATYEELEHSLELVRFTSAEFTDNEDFDITDYASPKHDSITLFIKQNEQSYQLIRNAYTEKVEIQEEYETSENTGWFRTEKGIVLIFNCLKPDELMHWLYELLTARYGENEFALLLKEKRYEEAFDAYEKYLAAWNTRKQYLQKIQDISETVKSLANSVLKTTKDQESDLKIDIENIQDKLRQLYKQLREKQLIIIGLQNGNVGEMNALQVFLEGMGERLISVKIDEDNNFEIQLQQELLFYDEEIYRSCHLRESQRNNCRTPWVFDMLDDIVLNKKLDLYLEETVRIDSNANLYCRQKDNSSYRRRVKLGIPNPHHYYYNCWGDNASLITKAYHSANYVIMINQVISAVGGINFADGAVVSKFLRQLDDLANSNDSSFSYNPCLCDKETGRRFTIKEYPEWKQNQKEGEKE